MTEKHIKRMMALQFHQSIILSRILAELRHAQQLDNGTIFNQIIKDIEDMESQASSDLLGE